MPIIQEVLTDPVGNPLQGEYTLTSATGDRRGKLDASGAFSESVTGGAYIVTRNVGGFAFTSAITVPATGGPYFIGNLINGPGLSGIPGPAAVAGHIAIPVPSVAGSAVATPSRVAVTVGSLSAAPNVNPPDPPPADYFVSKNGSNANGLSWATAWSELNQVDWTKVTAGKILEIDGGSTTVTSPVDFQGDWSTTRPGVAAGMLYTTKLTVGASGTNGNPITIRRSRAAGHNGTVVIFGGRQTMLPEAGSASYTATGAGRTQGIDVSGRSYITIDGMNRSGIMIYGCGTSGLGGAGTGVDMNAACDNVILRNLEIFDCGVYGTYNLSGGGTAYKTDQKGISLSGTHVTIDRCLIHDCGQDPVQADGAVSNLTLSYSWFYGRRLHSVWSGFGFNAGSQVVADQNTTHVDGIQCYAGGPRQSTITVDHCIGGPLTSQPFYFGDANNTSFDAVTIKDTTILAPFRHGIQGDSYVGSPPTPANWVIQRCTIHGPSTKFGSYSSQWLGVEVESGTGHSLIDTIITWGADFYLTSAFTGTCSGNIYNGTGATALPGGTNLDPVFTNALAATNVTPTWAQYMALDLTATNGAAVGKGSPINSIQNLLDRIDALNA